MASRAKTIGDLIAADASVAIPGDGVVLASDLADGSVTTAKLADANVTIGKIATTVPLGTKNRIINGDMRITQRGTSFSNPTAGFYTLDRWYIRTQNASIVSTITQSTTAPTGFVNSFYLSIGTGAASGSTDRAQLYQGIEGFNVNDLGWGTANAKTVTLSFWVRSSLTGQFGGALQNNAGNRSYPFTYTISSANTWEQKSVTIAGDTTGTWTTDNTAGIQLIFDLGAGSSFLTTAGSWAAGDYRGATGDTSIVATTGATFYITGIQLEVGDTATPFEHRPYDMELARCQRYYEKSFAIETAPSNSFTDGPMSSGLNGVIAFNNGTNVRGQMNAFKVTKRATPTITAYNAAHHATTGAWSGYNGTWTPITSQGFYVNTITFGVYGALSGASGFTPYLAAGGWAADAEL